MVVPASVPGEVTVFFHVQQLIHEIVPDEPDPAAANALQEGLGGQFGEMRTMMQYLFQSFGARGDARPYKDLIQGIGVEEISHVELITTTSDRGGHGYLPTRRELHASLILNGPRVGRTGSLGLVRLSQLAPTIAAWFEVGLSPRADHPLDLN